MEVSRPTICRMLGEARAVVARALANGWAIRIEAADEVLTGTERVDPEADPARSRCRGKRRGCGRGHGDDMLKKLETGEES